MKFGGQELGRLKKTNVMYPKCNWPIELLLQINQSKTSPPVGNYIIGAEVQT